VQLLLLDCNNAITAHPLLMLPSRAPIHAQAGNTAVQPHALLGS
jgi:hypothetical protein